MTPKMPKIGKCALCGKLLISDVYSLCWSCATSNIFSMPAQHGMEHLTGDEVESLYTEHGGEGG